MLCGYFLAAQSLVYHAKLLQTLQLEAFTHVNKITF